MDPDAALAELLDLARAHRAELDDESTNNHADTGQMADLVLGLHDWLSTGGFLSAAWAVGRATTSSPTSGAHSPESTDAQHEFEPMPGGGECMYVLTTGERCMKYESDHW